MSRDIRHWQALGGRVTVIENQDEQETVRDMPVAEQKLWGATHPHQSEVELADAKIEIARLTHIIHTHLHQRTCQDCRHEYWSAAAAGPPKPPAT